ncbi:MAG: GlxA family transcriptional regulator [Parvibaculaceae bacterium]
MQTAAPQRVTLVLIPRFNMMTLTTFIEPMRIANYLAPEKLYNWEYRSAEDGRVTASNGLSVDAKPLNGPEPDAPGDTIVVFGSWGADHYDNPVLLKWLRKQARAGKMLIAIELGVYALGRAGLLAGYRATTHWSCKAGFVESFPGVSVCEQLFTIDRNILTCGGGTAGLDLQLHLINQAHGEQLAAEVANQIMHVRRPAESAQRHAAGVVDIDTHPTVRAAMALLEASIEEPISVPSLCRKINVSQRQLERLFKRHAGCTIAQFSKLMRLQYARVLLTSTQMSIRDVSAACGFNSMSYFSQCFLSTFGRKPSDYRQAWPESEPTPQWPGTVYSFIRGSRHNSQPG